MSVTKHLKILVVDDEPLLTMTAADMLTDLGHQAVEAISGQAALDALRAADDFHLMITDNAMPGMTGVELAEQALALRPGLKIILATGYDNLPKGQVALTRLEKPYFEQDLIKAIETAMAS